MALKLSNLRNGIGSIEVPYAGESVEVDYRLAATSAESLDAIEAAAVERDELAAREAVYAFLEAAVVRWTILDDDDAELPPTRETMRVLPMGLLRAIFATIAGDDAVGKG